MSYPIRLLLLYSICPLVLFTVLFLIGFVSLWLYLLIFFFTICTCCCLLAFSLGHKKRPATLQTPSITSKTDNPRYSFSPSPVRKLTYDVFLSFRGADTRNSFTDFLYTSLTQRGIFTYRDDEELERGKSIGPNLLKAIEESRYAIVIFSQNYANSSWCLDEIAKVAECMKAMGQEVFPVFYHVDPSEVRWQRGQHFGKAFKKHEKRYEKEKINAWKSALLQVGNVSGWTIQNGSESKVIEDIVQNIFTKLNKIISSSKGLVGMDSHLKEMLSCLALGSQDVRIIGICGMGGIGKTTIAEAVYEKIQPHFDGYCFLNNVREVAKTKGSAGVVHLQKQLLSKLLKTEVNLEYAKMGEELMLRRLSTKKVLIVLDDVDQAKQLEALCNRAWFGPGSRIIITSRDIHLLSVAEGDQIYEVRPLTDTQAFQLFSMKAFKKDQLIGEDTVKLVKEFLYYADGLPLAIEILGSSVKGRSIELWPSMLDRLKKNPETKVIEVLRISFDGLEQREKQIFLDIACFFKGENVSRVRRILQGSDANCPDIDIQALLEKSLISLFGNKVWMHDLIQELGWEIVREECRDEPGGRSRLWLSNEIIRVLDRGKGSRAVQSISLLSPTKDDVVHSLNAFSVMDNLRLLKIWNVKFPGNIEYLSNELQYLEWYECPLRSFPSNFQPDILVELRTNSSSIQQLWTGGKGWKMLRFIDLRGSRNLISTPDFSEVLGLEILELEDCTSLVEVHQSLGLLKHLTSLNMKNCKLVESIPTFICLESLQFLNLSLCSCLKEFPEIEGNMKCLFELHLERTSFEVLLMSFEKLTALTTLDLKDCKSLLRLPSTMQFSTSLKSLSLTGCSKLVEIPENLNFMEYLDIGGTAISELSFLVGMKNLKYLLCTGCKGLGSEPCRDLAQLSSLTCLTYLDLSYCNLMDGAIPSDLSRLVSLTYLNLGGNHFVRLPESISQLSKLENLDLSNCTQLQLVPKLPSSVRDVSANDCTSLTDYPNQFKVLASRESGVTTIDSLNSIDDSAPKDAQVWRVRCSTLDGDTMRFVWKNRIIDDGHMEWEHQVDNLSAARSFQMDVALISSIDPICCAIADDVIPDWFSTISTWNFISIRIPPYLRADNRWRGVAVCAIFSAKGHDTMSLVELDSNMSSYFQCTLTTDIFHMKPSVLDFEEELRPLKSYSHLLSIFYIPYWQFPKSLIQATVMSALFESNNPSMEVQECGIRLVYEHDDGWFAKLLAADIGIRLNEVQTARRNSGWLSRVDTYWTWEPQTQLPSDQDTTTIVLRKNIESVLPRYLEAVQHTVIYKFNLSGCPGWCMNTLEKGAVLSPLSLNLHKCKKWMGIAIYGSMEEKKPHTIKEDYYVYLKLQIGRCHKYMHQRYVRLSEETDQLWFVYIPRAEIIKEFTHTSDTVLNIDFWTDSPVGEAQRGINIVDQEGLEAFAEAIIHCMQRVGTLDFYDKLVVGNWIDLIRLQGQMCTPSKHYSRTRREEQFELLSQKYKKWDWCTSLFDCKFFGSEISKQKWFMQFNKGNSAEIKMPQNVYDDWLGIVVCVQYRLSHENLDIILDAPESDVHVLKWQLEYDVSRVARGPFKGEATIVKLRPWDPSANWTYYTYVPRKLLKLRWQCNLVKATFLSSSPCLALHSCALRLVYKENIEDLVQTLTLSELP